MIGGTVRAAATVYGLYMSTDTHNVLNVVRLLTIVAKEKHVGLRLSPIYRQAVYRTYKKFILGSAVSHYIDSHFR